MGFLQISGNSKQLEKFSICVQLKSCLHLTLMSVLWQICNMVKASFPLHKNCCAVTVLGTGVFLMPPEDAI